MDSGWSIPGAAVRLRDALQPQLATPTLDALLVYLDRPTEKLPFAAAFDWLTDDARCVMVPSVITLGPLPPGCLAPDRLALMLVERHAAEALALDIGTALANDADLRLAIEFLTPTDGSESAPYSAGAMLDDLQQRLADEPRVAFHTRVGDAGDEQDDPWQVEQWSAAEAALRRVEGVAAHLRARLMMLHKLLDHSAAEYADRLLEACDRLGAKLDPGASEESLDVWVSWQTARVRLAPPGEARRVAAKAVATLYPLVPNAWRRMALIYRLYQPVHIGELPLCLPGSMDSMDELRGTLAQADDTTLDAAQWLLAHALRTGEDGAIDYAVDRLMLPDFTKVFGDDHVRVAALRHLLLVAAAHHKRGVRGIAHAQYRMFREKFAEDHPLLGRALAFRALAVDTDTPDESDCDAIARYLRWLRRHTPDARRELAEWQTRYGNCLQTLGRTEAAIDALGEAVTLTDQVPGGYVVYRALVRHDLAAAYLDARDPGSAERVMAEAVAVYGDPATMDQSLRGWYAESVQLLERIRTTAWHPGWGPRRLQVIGGTVPYDTLLGGPGHRIVEVALDPSGSRREAFERCRAALHDAGLEPRALDALAAQIDHHRPPNDDLRRRYLVERYGKYRMDLVLDPGYHLAGLGQLADAVMEEVSGVDLVLRDLGGHPHAEAQIDRLFPVLLAADLVRLATETQGRIVLVIMTPAQPADWSETLGTGSALSECFRWLSSPSADDAPVRTVLVTPALVRLPGADDRLDVISGTGPMPSCDFTDRWPERAPAALGARIETADSVLDRINACVDWVRFHHAHARPEAAAAVITPLSAAVAEAGAALKSWGFRLWANALAALALVHYARGDADRYLELTGEVDHAIVQWRAPLAARAELLEEVAFLRMSPPTHQQLAEDAGWLRGQYAAELGTAHPEILRLAIAEARERLSLGNSQQALEILDAVDALLLKVFGPDHPVVLAARAIRIDAYEHRVHISEAAQLMATQVTAWERLLPGDRDFLLQLLERLMELQRAAGSPLAVATCERRLALLEQVRPRDVRTACRLQHTLARLLADMKQHDAALTMALSAASLHGAVEEPDWALLEAAVPSAVLLERLRAPEALDFVHELLAPMARRYDVDEHRPDLLLDLYRCRHRLLLAGGQIAAAMESYNAMCALGSHFPDRDIRPASARVDFLEQGWDRLDPDFRTAEIAALRTVCRDELDEAAARLLAVRLDPLTSGG